MVLWNKQIAMIQAQKHTGLFQPTLAIQIDFIRPLSHFPLPSPTPTQLQPGVDTTEPLCSSQTDWSCLGEKSVSTQAPAEKSWRSAFIRSSPDRQGELDPTSPHLWKESKTLNMTGCSRFCCCFLIWLREEVLFFLWNTSFYTLNGGAGGGPPANNGHTSLSLLYPIHTMLRLSWWNFFFSDWGHQAAEAPETCSEHFVFWSYTFCLTQQVPVSK